MYEPFSTWVNLIIRLSRLLTIKGILIKWYLFRKLVFRTNNTNQICNIHVLNYKYTNSDFITT